MKNLARDMLGRRSVVQLFPSQSRLFTFEKEKNTGSVHLLFVLQDPGPMAALLPLVTAALEEDSVKQVSLHLGGYALQQVGEFLKLSSFVQISEESFFSANERRNRQELRTTGTIQERQLTNIAVVSCAGEVGPQSFWIPYGKDVLQYDKVFVLFDGWSKGLLKKECRERDSIETKIDGILCEDALAKKVVKSDLPSFPLERIYCTGTGQTWKLGTLDTESLRISGRKAIRAGENDKVILYLGNWEQQMIEQGAPRHIVRDTWCSSLKVFDQIARELTEGSLIVLFKKHPREKSFGDLITLCSESGELSPNLSVMNCPILGIDEAASAADLLCGIGSSELFKAPMRGKPGIFVGYTSANGASPLEMLYSRETVQSIRTTPLLFIADTTQYLQTSLMTVLSSQIVVTSSEEDTGCGVEKTLQFLLEGKSL